MSTTYALTFTNVTLDTLGAAALPLTTYSGSLLVDYATGAITGSLQVAPAAGIGLTNYTSFTLTPGAGSTYTITGFGQTAAAVNSTISIEYSGQSPASVSTQYYAAGVEAASGTGGSISSAASLVPSVVPESASVLAGMSVSATAANGALKGDSDPSGAGLSITSVARGSTSEAIAAGGSATIAGAYGSLTLKSDGSYNYAPTNGLAIVSASGTPQDVFNITVGDGTYSSTSTLAFKTSLASGSTETVTNASGSTTFSIGASTLTLSETGASTYAGTIQDGSSGNVGGKIVVAGPGTLKLASNSTFTGGTTISSGTVVEADVGGALSSGPVSIGTGAVLNLLNDTATAISVEGTTFTGAGTIEKTGSGTDTLGGAGTVTIALSQGGLIDVEGGVLLGNVSHQGSFAGNRASLNIASGALFNGQDGATQVDALTGSGTLEGGGVVGAGGTTIGVAGGSGTFSGTIVDAAGGELILTKTGAGTEVLSGANTYTGGTILSGGTLELASRAAAGAIVQGQVSVGVAGNGASVQVSSGGVAFAGAAATLQIDAAALTGADYVAPITGFTLGDAIDLRGLPYVSDDRATLAGAVLTVGDANASETLSNFALTSGLNTTYEGFSVASDQHGGTVLTFAIDAPSAPLLAAGQDTGVSTSDNITRINVPTFTGTALPGGTVTLYDGSNVVGTAAVGANGIYTVTSTHALLDGQHQIGASVSDGAGHTSAESALTTITIETMTPTAPAAPVLVSDTGTSSSDHITSNAAITYAMPASGDTLLYQVNNGAYSTTAPTFSADGTYSVTTEQENAAGLVSAPSAALTFTLETAAPTAPAAPVLTDDTSGGQGVTSNAAITYAMPASGDTLLYQVNNGGYSTTAPTFSADGTYSVTTEQENAAGLVSAPSAALTFTLETAAPTAPAAPVLVSDTGTSSTDNITSNAAITYAMPASGDTLLYQVNNGGYSTTAPTFSADGTYSVTTEQENAAGLISAPSAALTFTLETAAPTAPAAPVLVSDTGTSSTDHITSNAAITYAAPASGDTLLYQVNNGGYSTTAPTFSADGTYSVTTEQENAAGLVSAPSAALTFTLETAAPTAPAAPVLVSDTGTSSSDHITSNAAITYAMPASGDTLLYQVGNGAYSTTAPTFSADGTYSVMTEQENAAGLVSAPSAALTFTLETAAPTAPAAPVLTDDTSGGQGVTSNAAITYATPASGDTLLYQVNNGAYSTTAPTFSADGTYSVTTEQENAAGLVSAPSAALTFTLETAAPSAPGAPAAPMTPVLTNDTGTSSSDHITSNAAITYAAPASGDTLLYQVNNGGYSTTAPTFSADGTYSVTTEQENAAGLVSAPSAALTFTLETAAPTAPAAPVLVSDTGTSSTDHITSNAAITYAMPASGDTLLYQVNNGAYSNGGYSTTAPTFSADGTYSVTTEQENAAGLVSAPSAALPTPRRRPVTRCSIRST